MRSSLSRAALLLLGGACFPLPRVLPAPLRNEEGIVDGVCPCTQLAATTAGDGHVEVFARARDGTLWRVWEDGSASLPPGNSQALTTAGRGAGGMLGSPTAVTRDTVHVFYVEEKARPRAFGALEEITGGCAIGHPCAWTTLIQRTDHGGSVADPVAAVGFDRRIHVFARAPDGTVVITAETAPGETFSPWASLGKPGRGAAGRPSATRLYDGRLLVAALDADGSAWVATQTGIGGAFGPWQPLGAPRVAFKGAHSVLRPLVQPPAAASHWDGRAALFALAQDSAIYETDQATPGGPFGGWHSPPRVPSSPSTKNGPPTVATDQDGRLELLYANTDSVTAPQLWDLAQPTHSAWGAAVPRFVAFAADGFAPDRIAVARESDGREVVFFLDDQGRLHYARPSPVRREPPMAWFAPLPPLPVTASRPYTGSDDFMSLFAPGAAWSTAAGHVAVFKLYGEWVGDASDADRATVAADLARRGIPVAVEMGPLVSDENCGQNTEGFSGAGALEAARRLQAAGADVRYVALDEPFFYAHIFDGSNACHWDANKIAAQVRDFRDVWRGVYPAVQIGDIEPVTVGVTAQDYLDFLDAYWLAAGEPFAFLHLDITRIPGWPAVALALEQGARLRGVPVGMIYNGYGFESTDSVWLADALALAFQFETQVGANPEHAVFQSWNDKPDFTLPETSPTSFTHLIDGYFRPRTYLTLVVGGTSAKGVLFDQDGTPLAARSVVLTLTPLGQPAVHQYAATTSDGSYVFSLPPSAAPRMVEVTYAGDDTDWPAYAKAP